MVGNRNNIYKRKETNMRMSTNTKLLGLFSGFPARHFTDAIAQTLHENLPRRESLVFISARPEDYDDISNPAIIGTIKRDCL